MKDIKKERPIEKILNKYLGPYKSQFGDLQKDLESLLEEQKKKIPIECGKAVKHYQKSIETPKINRLKAERGEMIIKNKELLEEANKETDRIKGEFFKTQAENHKMGGTIIDLKAEREEIFNNGWSARNGIFSDRDIQSAELMEQHRKSHLKEFLTKPNNG